MEERHLDGDFVERIGRRAVQRRDAGLERTRSRLLRAEYPPGYTPKRPSAIMQPMPSLAGSVDDLAAYLAERAAGRLWQVSEELTGLHAGARA